MPVGERFANPVVVIGRLPVMNEQVANFLVRLTMVRGRGERGRLLMGKDNPGVVVVRVLVSRFWDMPIGM